MTLKPTKPLQTFTNLYKSLQIFTNLILPQLLFLCKCKIVFGCSGDHRVAMVGGGGCVVENLFKPFKTSQI
jgi:hypothetical protein